jgi:ArsR family transcriptional regulator, arsenate/arsenite/antimonite-responsive transcriptional repressor
MRLVAEITPECCPPILAAPLDRAEAERMAETLSVLSDAARLQLVSILAARPQLEACVCDLSGPLRLSQPTVSHHLRLLSDAGIVSREQRGRWAFFRLRPETLGIVADALSLAPISGEPAAETRGG